MGKRQKIWARRARSRLVEILGGRCKCCGTDEGLELDCIVPMGHFHHRMDSSARISFYRQQHREGNLQVLCSDCHTAKTAADLLLMFHVSQNISIKVGE